MTAKAKLTATERRELTTRFMEMVEEQVAEAAVEQARKDLAAELKAMVRDGSVAEHLAHAKIKASLSKDFLEGFVAAARLVGDLGFEI